MLIILFAGEKEINQECEEYTYEQARSGFAQE